MAGTELSRSTAIGLISLMVAVVIIAISYYNQRTVQRPRTAHSPNFTTDQTKEVTRTSDAGGAKTVATASSEPRQANSDAGSAGQTETDEADEKADPHFDYGVLPAVKGNANPQVRSVAEALRDKRNPERLSPLIAPKEFDPEAYKQTPDAYLNVVEPGRCFQVAQPAKGTPRLRPMSPQLQDVKQGESVKLRVQTAPNAPASFTAFDGGAFAENGLNAVTVRANEVGVAEATFRGTGGSINECNIMVGSPFASGTVKYLVNIQK